MEVDSLTKIVSFMTEEDLQWANYMSYKFGEVWKQLYA